MKNEATATREAWLKAGAAKLAGLIAQRSGLAVPPAYVSVGFPKGHRGRQRAIGQCWDGSLSADRQPHLFICPSQGEATRVLDILLHELIHATVGCAAGHKAEFAKVAKACGLKGPWTATTATDELRAQLSAIVAEIGPYPHAALLPLEAGKAKPGSRLRLWVCGCGVKVRVASDNFEATCGRCSTPFAKA